MQAIINFEYLISPVLADISCFASKVNNLRLLSELVSSRVLKAHVEEDIIAKMSSHNFFPSDKIFQSKLAIFDEEIPYTAKDITRLIYKIIELSCEYEETHVVEWNSPPVVTSKFNSISVARHDELLKFYSMLLIDGFFSGLKFNPMYYPSCAPYNEQNVKMSGQVNDVYPRNGIILPADFSHELKIFSDVNALIEGMDGLELYRTASSDIELKFSFYVGARALIKDLGLSTEIGWDDFKIGKEFLDSLKSTQSFQNQEFSSVTYNTIINLLAQSGKDEINYFYKSDDDSKPRTSGNYKAHRVHITKSGRALRLLFWMDDITTILSNVGNKAELYISQP